METAKDRLDRLLLEYADDKDAVEPVKDAYDDALSYPPEDALKQAKEAEWTLSLYY